MPSEGGSKIFMVRRQGLEPRTRWLTLLRSTVPAATDTPAAGPVVPAAPAALVGPLGRLLPGPWPSEPAPVPPADVSIEAAILPLRRTARRALRSAS